MEHGEEEMGEGFFTGPSEGEAGQGKTDLDHGEELFGAFEETEGGDGADVAGVGELMKAGAAGRDERDLGHGEKGIEHDDQRDEE